MYIEDLISQLAMLRHGVNSADLTILNSFADQFLTDTGLTEKQCGLALRILNRYYPIISQKLGGDLSHHLTFPKYRLKIRKSVTDQTVKIVKGRPEGPVIEVKFPYNEINVGKIRKYKLEKANSGKIEWDREATAWMFNLSEDNIRFLMDFCSQSNFIFDDEFQKHADDIELIMLDMEKHVPILAIEGNDLKILNSPKNMPKVETTDVIEAVFQARNMGVTLWDDAINEYLDSDKVNPVIRDFLKSSVADQFKLDVSDRGISALKLIIQQCSPCLVVIPGGSESEKLMSMYDILKGSGIEDKNMSVLFRLPNETGKNFNDFVKNTGINGPISDETKIVFVSTKLPKPLIKSGIKFNSVVNMGYSMAHYTLKEYTKNHQNFVNFGVKIKSEGFDFVKL